MGLPEAIAGADFSLNGFASGLSLEGLTQLSDNGRALPRLAESWSWSDDGLTLFVNLRSGVSFHDGTVLNAAGVSQNLEQAITKPSVRMLDVAFADITRVRASGDLQVALDLSRHSAFLPEALEMPLGVGTPAIGTGAYRVVSRSPAEIVLERNERYYLGVPSIARVVARPAGTLRSAWSSLLRGELDMVTNVPPDAVEFISNDTIDVVSFPRRYQYVIAFNSKRPPFTVPAVRKALNLAVDRPALITKTLQGHGVASTGPLWPQHWAYDSSVSPFGLDQALASELLSSNGFRATSQPTGKPGRLNFVCLLPQGFSVVERIALEVQKQLYDVGVDVTFESVRPEELDSRVRSGQFDAVLLDLLSGPTLGRAYNFWGSARSFQGLNLFGYENPEAERLFGVLRNTTNEGAIRSATRSLQRVMLDDPPALFLAWSQRSRAVRREFQFNRERDPWQTIWQWTRRPGDAAGMP